MIVFDNASISVGSVVTPTLFYHSDVEVTGSDCSGRYISCKVTLSRGAFLTHDDYYFSHCELNVDSSIVDVLAPLNVLSVLDYEDKAQNISFSDKNYLVSRLDSGNCLNFDKRYSFLEDLYVPLLSFNGLNWEKGLDLNEDTSFDYFFYYEDPSLRSSVSFSSGDHVGLFSPSPLTQSLLNPSGIVKYISGLLPFDYFIPEDVIKITGILDNYNTAGLPSLFPRDGMELRGFLRSLAVTLGRISNGVLSLKEIIRMLKTSSSTPDTYQMDLNKQFTFRVGETLFWYDPSTGLLEFNPIIRDFPFYFTDEAHDLRVVRIDLLPSATLNVDTTYLVYFNLDTSSVVTLPITSHYLFDTMAQLLLLVKTNNVVPLMGLRIDGVGAIEKMLFYQTALVNSTSTTVEKFNALIRSFATKSRSANLFSNIEKDSDPLILIRDVVNKSFAKDTRLFMFLQAFTSTIFTDAFGSFFVDVLGLYFSDPEGTDDTIYIEELT